MTPDLLARIYAALKAEPGLTPTGLSKRVRATHQEVREVLLAAEAGGHVRAELGEMGPGDRGRPRRYWLV